MKRPLDITSYNLRNVVFLGSSPFNSIQYKRIGKEHMTADDRANLVTLEACNAKKKECCKDRRCVWGVIRRTYFNTGNQMGQIHPIRK